MLYVPSILRFPYPRTAVCGFNNGEVLYKLTTAEPYESGVCHQGDLVINQLKEITGIQDPQVLHSALNVSIIFLFSGIYC